MKGNGPRLSLEATRRIIVEEQMKIRGQPGSLPSAQIAIFNRVRDEVGQEYAELLAIYDSMLMANQPPRTTTINLNQSTLGNLVLDSQVANITASVNAAAQNGVSGEDFAAAVKRMVEAALASLELDAAKKKELIESFEVVSEQAALAPERRKMVVVRPVLEAIPKLLGSANALITLWHSVGPHIINFFQ